MSIIDDSPCFRRPLGRCASLPSANVLAFPASDCWDVASAWLCRSTATTETLRADVAATPGRPARACDRTSLLTDVTAFQCLTLLDLCGRLGHDGPSGFMRIWDGSMLPGLEFAAGYLIAWASRKARRVGKQLDADADLVLDAELGRLHDLIAAKLGTDPALAKLQHQATAGQQVTSLTRRRVQDAIEDAADSDLTFATDLTAVLATLARTAPATFAVATGDGSVAVGGDVRISAKTGSAAAQVMGDVFVGNPPPDPLPPGRSGG